MLFELDVSLQALFHMKLLTSNSAWCQSMCNSICWCRPKDFKQIADHSIWLHCTWKPFLMMVKATANNGCPRCDVYPSETARPSAALTVIFLCSVSTGSHELSLESILKNQLESLSRSAPPAYLRTWECCGCVVQVVRELPWTSKTLINPLCVCVCMHWLESVYWRSHWHPHKTMICTRKRVLYCT